MIIIMIIIMIMIIIIIIIIITIIIIIITSLHHHIIHHDHHHIENATLSAQYVDWGNNINFIFMRDQNSLPPLNNMLTGVITSTLSS